MGLSQADRILLVLLDGGWHTTREILREVPSIVHSRVSDLRGQGFDIEHRTTGPGAAGSEYRLVATPTVEQELAQADAPEVADGQLTIDEAA